MTEKVEEVKVEDAVSDKIKKAFADGVKAKHDEDTIKIAMIAAGAKFKGVSKIYNDLMVEAGLAVSKEDKDRIVSESCANVDLSTEEGFDAAVAAVDKAIESTNEKGAATMIRAYARKNEIEYFKKPKSAGGTRTTVISDFYDELLKNPNMSEKEAHDFLEANGTANTMRWEKAHQRVRKLVNDIAEKYGK